jgi:tight adherence protein B
MTWSGWLLLAAALALVRPPGAAALRVSALTQRRDGRPVRLSAGRARPAAVAVGARHRSRAGPIAPSTARLVCAASLALGGGALVVLVGPLLGAALTGLAAVLARLAADARGRRTAARHRRELLTAVRLLAAELQAGARNEDALHAAAEAAPAFADALWGAAHAAHDGTEITDSLAAVTQLRPLADAWRAADGCGAPLGEVLAGVAADLGAATERSDAVAGALSAARSTVGLLAALPVLGLVLGSAMGARPLRFLLQTGAGHLTCCLAATCEALGLLWVRHLLRAAELYR